MISKKLEQLLNEQVKNELVFCVFISFYGVLL